MIRLIVLHLDNLLVMLLLTDCTRMQVFLHQLGNTGGSSLLPPVVLRILNSKACRSAIMFGDPLLPTECAELIADLKQTQLCFSCAHGRPTMAPLVNMAALKRHKQHLASVSVRQASSALSALPINNLDKLKNRLVHLISA